MPSLTIKILSEKRLRSTVTCHRSQRWFEYFLVFRCFSRATCKGFGKGGSLVLPFVRPLSHWICITDSSPGIFIGRNKLVSSEINFIYGYEDSSHSALLPVGTTDDTPSLAALQRPPALNQHCVCLEIWLYVHKPCSTVAERNCKEAIIWHILFCCCHGTVQKTIGEICCCWKSQQLYRSRLLPAEQMAHEWCRDNFCTHPKSALRKAGPGWSQLYLGKGKKLCYVGKGHVFTLSALTTVYPNGWGNSNMTSPVRLNFS